MAHQAEFFAHVQMLPELHYFWRPEILLSPARADCLDSRIRGRRGGVSGRKKIYVRVWQETFASPQSFDQFLIVLLAVANVRNG
jgi:DNA-binding winged helix-turn-helix (wHTH) protein